MKNNELNELHKDFKDSYKILIQPLYIKYRNIPSAIIRSEFVKFVVNNQHTKLVDLLKKRTNRKVAQDKLKTRIRELETEKALEDFLKI